MFVQNHINQLNFVIIKDRKSLKICGEAKSSNSDDNGYDDNYVTERYVLRAKS